MLKKLAGNPGKKKLNENEPEHPIPATMPPAPHHLSPSAGRVWDELGTRLLAAGLYTHVDKYALAMFCAAAGRWIDAELMLKSQELVLVSEAGNNYHNPLLSIANKSWEQMRQMLGQFGLSPAERARIVVPDKGKEADLADILFNSI